MLRFAHFKFQPDFFQTIKLKRVLKTSSASPILSQHPLIQCQLLLSISALWETVSDLFLPSNLSHKPHSWSAPPLGCLRKISKKCKSLALCCLVSIIGLSKHYFSIVCTFHLGPGSYGSIYSNIAIIKSAVFCSYPPYADMHYSLCDGNKSQRKPFI